MILIGAGRIGTALHDAAVARDLPATLVTRDAGWDALEGPPGDPVMVCTRNDDLPEVIARVPRFRRRDLCFVQNGMIGDLLARHHLADATRGLLFFAVPHKGADIEQGPEPSPFTGPLALEVVRWLVRAGVRGQVVEWPRFMAWELEKTLWLSAFGLLAQVFDAPVGPICDHHPDTLRALVAELNAVGRASHNVDMPLDWLLDRLVAYSRSIPDYRGAVKEWPTRNGWFVREGIRRGVPTPVHHDLLRRAGLGDRIPT
jgi:ketopantoate reductase